MAPFNIDAPEWGFLIIFLAERFLGGLSMEAGKNNENQKVQEKNDVLKSTQTVIHRALEKLGILKKYMNFLKNHYGC